MRNIAAPKAKEESQAGPRMLKVSLSDGSMTCHAVEVSPCPKISLKTAPGTKVRLSKGPFEVAGGFIKLHEGAVEVLGGRVEALVEKWLTAQSLAEFTRADLRVGSGGEVRSNFNSQLLFTPFLLILLRVPLNGWNLVKRSECQRRTQQTKTSRRCQERRLERRVRRMQSSMRRGRRR